MKKRSLENMRKIYKLSEDDILEILTEHLASECGFDTFQSRSNLYGEAGSDLRVLAVIGNEEDDDISKLDLEKLDREIEFNGSHSSLEANFLKKTEH